MFVIVSLFCVGLCGWWFVVSLLLFIWDFDLLYFGVLSSLNFLLCVGWVFLVVYWLLLEFVCFVVCYFDYVHSCMGWCYFVFVACGVIFCFVWLCLCCCFYCCLIVYWCLILLSILLHFLSVLFWHFACITVLEVCFFDLMFRFCYLLC